MKLLAQRPQCQKGYTSCWTVTCFSTCLQLFLWTTKQISNTLKQSNLLPRVNCLIAQTISCDLWQLDCLVSCIITFDIQLSRRPYGEKRCFHYTANRLTKYNYHLSLTACKCERWKRLTNLDGRLLQFYLGLWAASTFYAVFTSTSARTLRCHLCSDRS